MHYSAKMQHLWRCCRVVESGVDRHNCGGDVSVPCGALWTCSLVSVSHESSGITPYIKSPLQQHMAEVRTQHRLENLRNVMFSQAVV